MEARGAFRVCLVQNPAFCGFQVSRRDSGGVEPPTWAHLWALENRRYLSGKTARTGTGTVEAVKGQYTDAEGKCHVEALLFEEFGAMSAGVEEL